MLEYAEWCEDVKNDDTEPFCAGLAPDDFHKMGVSGGPPYGIYLPNPACDAILVNEWHNTTFVNYLRESFYWGGFPGFARYSNDEIPLKDLEFLKKDLLLF